MQIEKYLKANQPIIYKTFLNSLKENKLSHAYLISGETGSPLLEVAKFLAKSILCDAPNPLACDNCITCLRIDDDNYPDFVVINGDTKSIKKDEIKNIETQFEKEPFERKGIMVYILHIVESMTVEAVNSLLKFLEEPGKNVYAFLTTNNLSLVLPTIISRCQLLTLKMQDRNKVINESQQFNISQNDAELLSYVFNSFELIDNYLKENNEDYIDIKSKFEQTLSALGNGDEDDFAYQMQKEVSPLFKNKENAKMYLDFLAEAFQDLINLKNGNVIILKSYDKILSSIIININNVDNKFIEILKIRNLANSNVNMQLLFDHLINALIKE